MRNEFEVTNFYQVSPMATVRLIVFEGATEVYSQNDVIRGKVIVNVHGERDLKKVKGIWIRLKGKAKVRYDYSTTDSDGNQTYHTTYERETYIEVLQVLFGTGPNQSNVSGLTLPPGRSAYPFEFHLTSHKPLPPSLEVRDGHIRYTVKATLVVLGLIFDDKYKDKKTLAMVGPPLDLNCIPNVQEPLNKRVLEYNCCGCGSTVDVDILFRLPKRGYVPRESIYVLGHVDNHDGEERMDFTASLVQYVHLWNSQNSKTTRKETLSTKACLVTCPKGRVTEISVGPLQIPQVPRSGPPGCNIINVEYFVKIKGEKIPVTIGTVPVRAAIPPVPDISATAPPPEPTSTTGLIVSMPPQYGTLPPNYDEAMRMATGAPSEGSVNYY